MSERVNIKIFERDTTITPSKLRTIGYIPATVYGNDREPIQIQLKSHEFQLAWARGVRLYHLEGVGEPLNAEVKQVQKQNVKDSILHIEFFVPAASEKKQKNTPNNQKAKADASVESAEKSEIEEPREALV